MLHKAIFKIMFLCLLPLAALAQSVPVKDLQGKERHLTEFVGKGQWTVVMFYEYSCAVCNAEAPNLEAFHRKHSNGKAKVIGLSVNGSAYTRSFIQEHDLSFENLLVTDENAALLFYDATGDHLPGTPGFLIYSPDGEVRTYQVGPLDLVALERFIERFAAVAGASE